MEIIFISLFGIIISALYIKHAPMTDLRLAMYYADLQNNKEKK